MEVMRDNASRVIKRHSMASSGLSVALSMARSGPLPAPNVLLLINPRGPPRHRPQSSLQKWSCFQETGGQVKLPSPFSLTPHTCLSPPPFRLPGELWGESQGFMRTRCLSLVMAPLKLFFGDAKCIPNIKMLFVAFDFYFIKYF